MQTTFSVSQPKSKHDQDQDQNYWWTGGGSKSTTTNLYESGFSYNTSSLTTKPESSASKRVNEFSMSVSSHNSEAPVLKPRRRRTWLKDGRPPKKTIEKYPKSSTRKLTKNSIWDPDIECFYELDLNGQKLESDSDDSTDTQFEECPTNEWEGRFDFVIAGISYSIGSANIIGFPQLVYANGGSAFLLIYLVFVCLLTIPLLFLETAIGQFSSLGCIAVWRCSPLFKGIGYCIFLATVDISYAVTQAWVVFYLIFSFMPTLPWASCKQEWNTKLCYAGEIKQKEEESLTKSDTLITLSEDAVGNFTDFEDVQSTTNDPQISPTLDFRNFSEVKSASEEFFVHQMLQHNEESTNNEGIRWPLMGCLLMVYVVVYSIVVFDVTKGKKRFLWFAMLGLPFVLLLAMLGFGVTLPGASTGITAFFTPKWEHLNKFDTYKAACSFAIYDIGLGFGVLITFASFNKFKDKLVGDIIVVVVVNFLVGISGGVTLFSYIGYISEKTKKPLALIAIGKMQDDELEHDNVTGHETDDGSRYRTLRENEIINKMGALVFVGMPEAIASLQYPRVVAICFFVMLLVTGLRTMVFSLGAATNSVVLDYPELYPIKNRVTASIAGLIFFMSLSFVSEGGIFLLYVYNLFNSSAVVFICFLEVFVITWVYGYDRWNKDIELMLGRSLPRGSRLLFKFFLPPCLLMFNISDFVSSYTGSTEQNEYSGYTWIQFIPLLPLVPCGIVQIRGEESGRLEQRMRKLLLSPIGWGPKDPDMFVEYIDTLSNRDLEERESVMHGMDVKRFRGLCTEHRTLLDSNGGH